MKDDLVYAGHMLDTARRAIRLVTGETRETFESNETLNLALTHLIQTIGEAARRGSQNSLRPIRRFPGARSSGCATESSTITSSSISTSFGM